MTEVKKANRGRAYNVIIRKSDDDVWDEVAAEPVADPIPASVVGLDEVRRMAIENPWQAPVSPAAEIPTPGELLGLNGPQTDARAAWLAEPVDGADEANFLSFNDKYFD